MNDRALYIFKRIVPTMGAELPSIEPDSNDFKKEAKNFKCKAGTVAAILH